MLQGMIVRLTNIIHAGEEYLSVSSIESDITLVRFFFICFDKVHPIVYLQASNSDENLSFSGTASVQSYAKQLRSISYIYQRMISIIDNTPDLSPR